MGYLPLCVHVNEAGAGGISKAGLLRMLYKETASEAWGQFLQSKVHCRCNQQASSKGP